MKTLVTSSIMTAMASCHAIFLLGTCPVTAQDVDSPFPTKEEGKLVQPFPGKTGEIPKLNTFRPPPTPVSPPPAASGPDMKTFAKDMQKIIDGQKKTDEGTKRLIDELQKNPDLKSWATKFNSTAMPPDGSPNTSPPGFGTGGHSGYQPINVEKVSLLMEIQNLKAQLQASESAREALHAEVVELRKFLNSLEEKK
ncbi:MAG: hypothetical protein EOP88_07775 [Verrucomicrobiaceae bacterium]|nr:MAG: hypothetical protein EOP88_07775 [Verrucomicrobiaceae bacterium]